MSRQALELALEALKKGDYALVNAICEELKQAQPEQEPLCTAAMFDDAFLAKSGLSPHTKLYTTPPQRTWVGLTDEEVEEIERWVEFKEEGSGRIPMGKLVSYISEKLRNKNT